MTEHVTANVKQPTQTAQPVVGILQRACACGQHTVAGGECEECRKKREGTLQRAAVNNGPVSDVPPIVHDVLRSPGQPLDPATRAFMEPRFGHDFSHVRVHMDVKAAESAQAVDALAYTVGRDVVFGAGRYAPGTRAGQMLLAHELTHVVQQHLGQSQSLQRQADSETNVATEVEADRTITETKAQEEAKPTQAKAKKVVPQCTRTILAEGTCANLVAGSKYICCDPENGIERKDRKTDIDGKECPSRKFTPIFTCDNNCKTALKKGCSDSDNWMAVPDNQFEKQQCGDIWTICANGRKTTGYVRDHSVTQTRFEVSPAIQKALGVTVGDSFKGAVYIPGAKQAAIDADSCCNS